MRKCWYSNPHHAFQKPVVLPTMLWECVTYIIFQRKHENIKQNRYSNPDLLLPGSLTPLSKLFNQTLSKHSKKQPYWVKNFSPYLTWGEKNHVIKKIELFHKIDKALTATIFLISYITSKYATTGTFRN